MELERFARIGLKVTGIVQSVSGLAAALAPALFTTLMYGRDVTTDPLLLRIHVMGWLMIVALGVAYGHAGFSGRPLQPSLLLAATLGKAVFAIACIELMVSGHGTAMLLGGIGFDAVLSTLFGLTFLSAIRAQPEARAPLR